MRYFDRVLAETTAAAVEAALRDACRPLEAVLRRRLWPLDAAKRHVERVLESAEGEHRWGGAADGWCLRLTWWSDCLDRRHVRVVGADRPEPEGNPPLWGVYPEHCVWLGRGGDEILVVVCPCGVVGTPEEVAWMGRECGPCHDRREAGSPAEQPWALPRYTETGWRALFAPDGSAVALAHGDLRRWHLARGRTTQEVRPGVFTAAYAPGGELVVSQSPLAGLAVWAGGPSVMRRLREVAPAVYPFELAFTGDGRWLVGWTREARRLSAWAWSWPACELVWERVEGPGLVGVGPGSRLVLLDLLGREVEEVDPERPARGQPRPLIWPEPLQRDTPDLAALALGDGVAWTCDGGGHVARIDLAAGAVTARRRLDRDLGVGLGPTPEGDGLLVQAGERLHLLDAETLEVRGTLHGGRGTRAVPPACNGHWLALGGDSEGQLRLAPWPPLRDWLRKEAPP